MLLKLVSRARIFAVLLLLALPAVAQEQEQGPLEVFGEEIVVAEVLLDVLVTDKQGNVIVGLGPEDFTVKEDGKEFEVESVAFYSNWRALDVAQGSAPERTDRYFILFFHDQSQVLPSLVPRQLEAGRWTKRWVERELLLNDRVAVLAYDVKLKVYQDFTNDKDAILRAIDRAIRRKKPRENWPSRLEEATDEDSPWLLANLPQGKELAKKTRKIQQALTEVAGAAAHIVGRKNLLLFSVGFGEVNDFGVYQPDIRYYPDMEQSLNDGNVAVYSIDLLPATRGGDPNARGINDALSSISADTGGHYYFSYTNALSPLRKVSDDNNGYYLLSYTSHYEAGTSGYRRVKVTTRNPELQVRARRGYLYGS